MAGLNPALGAVDRITSCRCCWLVAPLAFTLLDTLDLASGAVVAFALAFSSTVFAVVMYRKGETNADHAKTAIGILIMQDIFAVVFLTASKGQVPSILAIPVVLGLIYLRKPLGALLARSGHGELLVLSGSAAAVGRLPHF